MHHPQKSAERLLSNFEGLARCRVPSVENKKNGCCRDLPPDEHERLRYSARGTSRRRVLGGSSRVSPATGIRNIRSEIRRRNLQNELFCRQCYRLISYSRQPDLTLLKFREGAQALRVVTELRGIDHVLCRRQPNAAQRSGPAILISEITADGRGVAA